MNNRISPFSDLTGRVVIVTGAAAGIGLSISNAFAEQGCQLVLLDVNETSLTETAKSLEKSGTHVITVAGSVAEPETARHIVLRLFGSTVASMSLSTTPGCPRFTRP